MCGTDQAPAPFDPLRMARRRDASWRQRSSAVGCESRRNLHNGPRFRLETMAPDLREGQVSVFAKRIMRKPRTLHCPRSEEHTSELQSHLNLVCRLLLEKKNIANSKL